MGGILSQCIWRSYHHNVYFKYLKIMPQGGGGGRSCLKQGKDIRILIGIPAVVQQDWRCLGSTGMQTGSLAQQSGLRIHHCRRCNLGRSCRWDLIPGPGTPYAIGWPKKTQMHKSAYYIQLSL